VLPYRWWTARENSPLWNRVYRMIFNFATIPQVVRQLKIWNPDVVVTNTITVCVGAFAAKILNVPHVWYIHEFGYEDHKMIYILGPRISSRLMDKLSAACIACSQAVAEKYRPFISPEKMKVVHYSVSFCYQPNDPHDFKKLQRILDEKADIQCAIVGTLQEGKGQKDALRAIGELIRKGIKAHLYIAGEGSKEYKRHLNDLIEKDQIGDHVTFMGHVPNGIQVMQSVDIVLMCSRMEAFGRVTVEAMLAGKPVIGARSGGTRELIRENFNGLLYTPGNYLELAEKILYLYRHPDMAREMGLNGQKWATAYFTEERYGGEVLAILEEILK